ncbi:MAG: ribonuclease P protein component [Bacteroidales bacterium]|nr:ribonuclease P protein component [Bacteroidales bacterium]
MNVRNTLKKNSEFRRLYSKGKSAVNSHMAVYCRRNGGEGNRLGYTVSAKLGHAVVRNRVRRRLREIVRLNAPKLKTGWDIVLVARRRCVDGDYHKMEAAFLRACGELGLLREGEE